MSPTLLVVDDEPEILETTRWAFELAGFDVHTASTAEEALSQTASLRPQILLIDYKLPNLSGMAVLKAAKSANPQAVAFMITGLTHDSDNLEAESRKLGAAGFFHKPLPIAEMLRVIANEVKPSQR